MPEANKLVALCLYVLLTAGAWVPLVTTDRENSTAEADPAWEARTHGTREGGNGTKVNPFLIYNVDDLRAMKDNLTEHYVLANDIDASATREWNDGAGFEPVGAGPGDDLENHFTGSLDGGGYVITGLYIDRGGTDYVGLFGFVGIGGEVKNVGLVDVDVTGAEAAGGLVGYLYHGSVSNSYATGSVSGEGGIGGLVGANMEGSVSNSYATGSVRGSSLHVGGLVGWNGFGSVSNSYATGSVSGNECVGGLVGWNMESSVSNSYATGSVTGDEYIGGLVGVHRGSMSNCYSTGSVTGTGLSTTGGLVGYRFDGSVKNCFWDKDTSGMKRSSGGIAMTTGEMKTQSSFTNAGWNFTGVWWMIDGSTYPLLQWQDAPHSSVIDEPGMGTIAWLLVLLIALLILLFKVGLGPVSRKAPERSPESTGRSNTVTPSGVTTGIESRAGGDAADTACPVPPRPFVEEDR